MPPLNYQPRGLSQTPVNGYYGTPTSGDVSLRAQQTQYELLSQQFVGTIAVTKNGEDITLAYQNALLALMQQNPMTVAAAQGYFSNITPTTWSPGIIDWKATYNAQLSLAKTNGWA